MSQYSPYISDAEVARRRRDEEQAGMMRRLGLIGATVGPALGAGAGAVGGGIVGTLAGGNTLAGIGTGAGLGGTAGTALGQFGNILATGAADGLQQKWDDLDARRLARAKFITENFRPYTGR